MGRRGPLPKPAALKILSGNPGKRPVRRPTSAAAGVVTCPGWLTGEARAEWRRLAPFLSKAGLLTPVDRNAFAAYCLAIARWKECQRVIDEFGSLYLSVGGRLLERPEVSMAHKFAKEARAIGAEFGLSPASRARLDAPDNVTDCQRCSLPEEICACR